MTLNTNLQCHRELRNARRDCPSPQTFQAPPVTRSPDFPKALAICFAYRALRASARKQRQIGYSRSFGFVLVYSRSVHVFPRSSTVFHHFFPGGRAPQPAAGPRQIPPVDPLVLPNQRRTTQSRLASDRIRSSDPSRKTRGSSDQTRCTSKRKTFRRVIAASSQHSIDVSP
jgi:hypothetical protein